MDYIEKKNKQDLDYKITFFHGFLCCFAKAVYNRPRLNRFIKNKCLYERKNISFAFIAKDKLKDAGEERIVCVDVKEKDNFDIFTKRVAYDIFKVRKEGTNDMDGILKLFTILPNWLLSIVVKFVFFLDRKGINPKVITEGDTNYATIIFSNLGSIKTNSVYHHVNEYGTNSIVVTIGTIREENNKKIVDVTVTLDERIADGFYFAKSIQLVQYIADHPELLDEAFNTKIDLEEK